MYVGPCSFFRQRRRFECKCECGCGCGVNECEWERERSVGVGDCESVGEREKEEMSKPKQQHITSHGWRSCWFLFRRFSRGRGECCFPSDATNFLGMMSSRWVKGQFASFSGFATKTKERQRAALHTRHQVCLENKNATTLFANLAMRVCSTMVSVQMDRYV
jgi:hypothetical protein